MEKAKAVLANAATLLQDLTTDKVKASELKKCAGVAFVFSYKAGLIVSFQHGQGFLLRKVRRMAFRARDSATGRLHKNETGHTPQSIPHLGSRQPLTTGVHNCSWAGSRAHACSGRRPCSSR